MKLHLPRTDHVSSKWRSVIVLLALIISSSLEALAQNKEIIINLAPLDGVALTPENIFSFGIQSTLSTGNATVKGTVRFRQSGLSFSYSFNTVIRQGMNMLDGNNIRPIWTWSTNALRELFQDYHTLPEGTYEYCVTILPVNQAGEPSVGVETTECMYGKKEDLFLINLVDPENNAKIYEHYPVFSWIVNYPFASQLTYRIRVAEIKEGQNTISAITRNNPVCQESNLPQTTVTYPVYSTPLKVFQPYAWTVDAYYKGILLGGAEPWKFTIIEDSEMATVPHASLFVDIKKEENTATYYAVGDVKLKYMLDEKPSEILTISLQDNNGKQISIKEKELKAVLGDNRFEINLKDQVSLKHLGKYVLSITNSSGQAFRIAIKYVNPDFLK